MTPTPPQEQTEREAFESWIRTQPRHEGANLRFLALNDAYIDFDVHGSWQAWQARASMQAQAPEVAALQREVEELRGLLIDARDTLCDLDTAYAYSLRNRIDAAMASKAEVPNG